jgi:hypothetical protein
MSAVLIILFACDVSDSVVDLWIQKSVELSRRAGRSVVSHSDPTPKKKLVGL